MPEIRQSEPTPDPHPPFAEQRRRLIDAINWAHIQGYDVALTGELGVVCVSTAGAARWMADPDAEGPSPIGCVVLHRQPPARTDPDLAAAIALDMAPRCMEALAVGLAGLSPMTCWNALANRTLVLQAWMLGVEVRAILHRSVTRLTNARLSDLPREG